MKKYAIKYRVNDGYSEQIINDEITGDPFELNDYIQILKSEGCYNITVTPVKGMTYTDEQIKYITAHGGVIDDCGHIRISYKAFRKIAKDYTGRDIFDNRVHVWLIPGSALLKEGVHFSLVK